MTYSRSLRRRAQHGLTLIELMVALLISAILSLAIFAVLGAFEGRKRTTTTVNDASQAGNYAMYVIDRLARSAGSGIVQGGPQPQTFEARRALAYGCRLLVAQGGSQLWPRTPALPAPFANLAAGTAGTLRVAPVVIAPSQSQGLGFNNEPSDLLIVMAGSGGWGEAPHFLSTAVAANTATLTNAFGVAAGNLLLLANQPTSTSNVDDCMIQQVGSVTAPATVGLSGTYAAAAIAGVSQGSYGASSLALNLGSTPSFMVFGVGDNATLMSYDLLQQRTPALQAVADNVYELHALYGADLVGSDGTVDTWIDPRTATGTYALANLMNGSVASAAAINQIKALRVALVLRSALRERDAVSPATLEMFRDVGMTRTRTLSADEQQFRYRVVEATIPLRNAMLTPPTPPAP